MAQLERQIRAVHRTMRQIEKLRRPGKRVGRELSNGERVTTLTTLAAEMTAIDRELQTQHESCGEMQQTIAAMQARLRSLTDGLPSMKDTDQQERA